MKSSPDWASGVKIRNLARLDVGWGVRSWLGQAGSLELHNNFFGRSGKARAVRLLYFVACVPGFQGNHGQLDSIRGGSQNRVASWHLEPHYLGQWEVEQAESGPGTEK